MALNSQSDTTRVEMSGSSGGSYRDAEGDVFQVSFQPQYLPGLFNQGLDAHHVLTSMEHRMDEMNDLIARLAQQQAADDAAEQLLQEKRRREKIMQLEEQSFSAYESYHNRFDPALDTEAQQKPSLPLPPAPEPAPEAARKAKHQKRVSHFMLPTQAYNAHHGGIV